MNKSKTHIIYKGIVLLLIASFLVPSLVKFAHVFENHKHEVCEAPQKSHYHTYELDCEFYKFNLNPHKSVANNTTEFVAILIDASPIQAQYQSISKYQRLSISLRGPPGLV